GESTQRLKGISKWLDDLEQLGFERATSGCARAKSLGCETAYDRGNGRREAPCFECTYDLRTGDRLRGDLSAFEERREISLLLFGSRRVVRRATTGADAAQRAHQLRQLVKRPWL